MELMDAAPAIRAITSPPPSRTDCREIAGEFVGETVLTFAPALIASIILTISFALAGDRAFASQYFTLTAEHNRRKTPDIEYLYKYKYGKRVDVFNTTKNYIYVESDDYIARRDGVHDTEFAGQIMYCTGSKYYCVRGGIYAVVPRLINGQTDWAFRNVFCHTKARISKFIINKITCKYRGIGTDFYYDKNKGIISYSNIGEPSSETILIGNVGLFGPTITHPSPNF